MASLAWKDTTWEAPDEPLIEHLDHKNKPPVQRCIAIGHITGALIVVYDAFVYTVTIELADCRGSQPDARRSWPVLRVHRTQTRQIVIAHPA